LKEVISNNENIIIDLKDKLKEQTELKSYSNILKE
jgi:hypothetical protein